jgi:hypothetical protein
MSGGSLCFPDELLNSAVHDAASGKPRITPSAYMIIRDATTSNYWEIDPISRPNVQAVVGYRAKQNEASIDFSRRRNM